MPWYAKPSGGYDPYSVAGISNIDAFRTAFSTWSVESIAGMLGNVQAESGFNPWRWQGDTYGTSRGYGLFQFTPASSYLALSGATPNLSTTGITTGATPEDADRQIQAFRTDELGKWAQSAWRSYWDTTTYASLYAYRQECLDAWGHGTGISIAEFSECQDVYAATFLFLACFEGPLVPNIDARNRNARTIYHMLTGDYPEPPYIPPDPEPPSPTPVPLENWLIAVLKKISERRV